MKKLIFSILYFVFTAAAIAGITTQPFAPNISGSTLPVAITSSIYQGAYTSGTGAVIGIESAAAGGNFTGRRANTSFAAPSALAAGNTIVALNAQGYGATGYASGNAGRLLLLSDGAWTDASTPTSFVVSLTPSGSTTAVTVATIDSNGMVVVNSNAAPVANFRLGGNNSLSSWTTNGAGLRAVAATYTNTSTATSGTAATGHINTFAQPTIAASNTGVTVTDAATVYIANAPANGTNVTVTTPYALEVAAGTTKLQTVTATGLTTDSSNHVQLGGNSPAVSTCGSSPSVSGNDSRGTITVGSGVTTACTLTFGSSYSSTPVCIANDNSGAISTGITAISTSAVTFGFSASLASGKVYYICLL